MRSLTCRASADRNLIKNRREKAALPEPPAPGEQAAPNPVEPSQGPERTLPEIAVPNSQSASMWLPSAKLPRRGMHQRSTILGPFSRTAEACAERWSGSLLVPQGRRQRVCQCTIQSRGHVLQGPAVPQDYGQAYFWLALAASGTVDGVKQEDVDKWRDDAASQLSPETLAQRQEGVRKWLEGHPQKVE